MKRLPYLLGALLLASGVALTAYRLTTSGSTTEDVINHKRALIQLPTIDFEATKNPKPPAEATASPDASESAAQTVTAKETVTALETVASTDVLPTSCGSWSAADAEFGVQVASKYGPLSACLLLGKVWVISTEGAKQSPGAIGVFRCPDDDERCLDGRNSQAFSAWTFVSAPSVGTVKLVHYFPPDIVRVYYGSSIGCFKLKELSFSSCDELNEPPKR